MKVAAKYAKGIAAGATALAIAIADGVLDVNDGVTVGLAVLGAIGVYIVPNKA